MTRYGAILAVTALLSLSDRPAVAQWVNTMQEDAFDGDQHMAVAADGNGYGVGFKCSKATDLTLFYATPERVSTEVLAFSQAAELAVIIDSDEPISLLTVADHWDDGKLRFLSTDPDLASLAIALGAAKRRFAITAKMAGKNFHSRTFPAGGSGKAIGKLVKMCGIEAPAREVPGVNQNDAKTSEKAEN